MRLGESAGRHKMLAYTRRIRFKVRETELIFSVVFLSSRGSLDDYHGSPQLETLVPLRSSVTASRASVDGELLKCDCGFLSGRVSQKKGNLERCPGDNDHHCRIIPRIIVRLRGGLLFLAETCVSSR